MDFIQNFVKMQKTETASYMAVGHSGRYMYMQVCFPTFSLHVHCTLAHLHVLYFLLCSLGNQAVNPNVHNLINELMN